MTKTVFLVKSILYYSNKVNIIATEKLVANMEKILTNIEKVLKRVKQFRTAKGYTLENMANELNISASTYRKVEMNKTKLTVEKLIKITEILEIHLEDILDTNTAENL